jgi:diguanylate cyclase (GGDEF)-like protein/PAS domain S-box-containing protein
MRPRWVWTYLVVALVAAGLHWRLPTDLSSAVAWDLIAVTAVAGCWVGLRCNRPSDSTPWRLLALGITLLVAGDLVWDISVYGFGHSSSFVPLSDVVYLSAYPLLACGLISLGRTRARGRGAVIDGTVVALVLAAPMWQLVVSPALDSTGRSATVDQIITAAYPILDCVLIVAVAYLVFTLPRWNVAALLVVVGILLSTVGDIIYARLGAAGELSSSAWLDPLWPAFYSLLAAAMLHPSMRALGEPQESNEREPLDRTRAMLLAASLLVVPVMLAIELETGNTVSSGVVAALSVAIAALVGWRLVELVRETDRAHDSITRQDAQFRALVRHASDAIAVNDIDGDFVYVSPAVERLLGYPPEAFLGRTVFDFLHPDDRDEVAAFLGDLIGHPGRTFVVEARSRHADGSWRWLETTATNHLDEPSVTGFVSNFRDVTKRKHADEFEEGEMRVLEMIARGAPLRTTLEELLVTAEGQLDGRVCSLHLVDPDGANRSTVAPSLGVGDAVPARWCVSILASDRRRQGVLSIHGTHDRTPGAAEVALVERVAALTAVAVERNAAEDRLEHQAFHDPLTGLPNRALVLDRLAQALLRLNRSAGNVGVMFLDLDRFKVINDSLGHDAGDELLVEIGRRLANVLQAADTVARFGGDEFVVVCERLQGVADARSVAERLSRALAEPYTLSHGGVVVASASIGIALASGPNDRPETLLRDADAAMYRAKERGGARTEVFDAALRSHVVVRLETERALRRALERGHLRVHFQPVVELAAMQLVGAEALVRWQRAGHGLVSPGEFVGIAEETGLIVPIGAWVIGEACTELARQQTLPGEPIVLSVNLSGRQLGRPELVDVIRDQLDVAGVEPELLCLEVTESVLLDDVDGSVAALTALKDLGVLLAIDDFGTGYSSLGYLKQFPFDILKIDQAFVAGLGTNDADDTIVLATTQMAHALGMRVVVEGVETERQRDRSRELGCDMAQGFLFAPPGHAEDLLGRIERLRIVEA